MYILFNIERTLRYNKICFTYINIILTKVLINLKKIILLLIVCSTLVACGSQPLKSRSVLEAEQYIWFNLDKMNWETFQELTVEPDIISEEDFHKSKEIAAEYDNSKLFRVGNTVYRVGSDNDVLFVTRWDKVDQLFKMKSIEFPSELVGRK